MFKKKVSDLLASKRNTPIAGSSIFINKNEKSALLSSHHDENNSIPHHHHMVVPSVESFNTYGSDDDEQENYDRMKEEDRRKMQIQNISFIAEPPKDYYRVLYLVFILQGMLVKI